MALGALRYEHESPSCTVASFQDVVLVLVHSELTAESLKASESAHRRIALAFPRRVGCHTFVNLGVKNPDAAIRRLAADTMAATREHLRCAAQVLAGEGFWPSTARSVITAVERLRPDDRPRRTFPDVTAAVEWMAVHMERDAEWQKLLLAAAKDVQQASAA
jgi:hypothetical protein